jgi:hypothetical protein
MVKGWGLFGTKILIIGCQQKEINQEEQKGSKFGASIFIFWGKPQKLGL